MSKPNDPLRSERRKIVLQTFPLPFALGVGAGLAMLLVVEMALRLSGTA